MSFIFDALYAGLLTKTLAISFPRKSIDVSLVARYSNIKLFGLESLKCELNATLGSILVERVSTQDKLQSINHLECFSHIFSMVFHAL